MKRAKQTKRIKSVTETASPSSEKPHSGGLVGRKFTVWLNATTPKHHGTVVAQVGDDKYLVEIDDTKVRHLIQRDATAQEVSLARRRCDVETLSPNPVGLLKIAATLPLFAVIILDVNSSCDLDLFIVGKR